MEADDNATPPVDLAMDLGVDIVSFAMIVEDTVEDAEMRTPKLLKVIRA